MLSDETISRRPSVNNQPFSWNFGDFPVQVTISDEDGRIDINHASDWLILAFLSAQGIPTERSQLMIGELRNAQGISDSRPRASADSADSVDVGSTISARTPIMPIQQIRSLPSWQETTQDCWFNSLTVYSGLPEINPADVTADVMNALKWADKHNLGDRPDLQAQTSLPAHRSYFGDVIRIRASIDTREIRISREWIGRLTADAKAPALSMQWNTVPATWSSDCANSPPQ